MNNNDIVAVIPAYNEELTIGSVVLLTIQTASKTIVVDDGSVDRTSEIASRAGADVIRLDKNQGKAKAVMTGLKKARDLNPAVVVLLDADGQNNPSEIAQVIRPVLDGKADLVIGSRFIDSVSEVPKYRRIGQKTLDYTQNLGTAFKTTDSQSGFRALSKKALEYIDFFSEEYNIESDMINHFYENGLTIIEVPITVRYDVPHKHKQNPFRHGWSVISNIVGYIGYKRPLLLFGLPGAISSFIGIVLGFWAFDVYNITLKFPIGPTLMSILLIVSGLLMIIAALILNSLVIIINQQNN
jgi:glycosyltransferase involved in cell wall biosynthesis